MSVETELKEQMDLRTPYEKKNLRISREKRGLRVSHEKSTSVPTSSEA
jgi:hypothetical protein